MTERHSTGSVISDHPVELAVAAAVGVAAGAAVVILLGGAVRTVGDEPPIRVRNGSVDLRLQGGHWDAESSGDKKNWKIKGEPSREKDDFEVVIWGAGTANCADSATIGNGVTFTVQQGTSAGAPTDTIVIKSNNNKTKIKSGKDLDHDGKLIKLPGADWFIHKIEVGSATKCTLTNTNATLRVALLHPDQ